MSVYANGRSILHKGHGKTQLAVAPDVCKTPSPGGPVPLPYPNMSPDSNLTKGAATVKIKGNPVANVDSQLSRSSGDEPGTAGGIVSSRNMGAFGWPAGSIDVNAEGKGVIRLLDSNMTNGNAYNSTGVDLGEPELGYGDDAECPRVDCKLGRDLQAHRVRETPQIADLCSELVKEVEKMTKKQIGRIGRMVGVGQCGCTTYKAVSGSPKTPTTGPAGTVCDTVQVFPPGDVYMGAVLAVNNWVCAAVKIISNAGGHRLLALSEKWVGANEKGVRKPKTFVVTEFILPVATLIGPSAVPSSRSDRVRGQKPEQTEVQSGGSVPSCGKCQTFLPAMICETKPCSAGGG